MPAVQDINTSDTDSKKTPQNLNVSGNTAPSLDKHTSGIIRSFLSAVVPWPGDGLEGFVNIHGRVTPSAGKPYWWGIPCASVKDATRAIGTMLKSADPTDIYACTSLQSQYEEKLSRKTGKPWKSALRRAENAVALKSFFIDMDFGKDGHGTESYATEEDARTALADFIKQVDLPEPTYVNKTGGGHHVWWCLAEAITPIEWQPYADALAKAGRECGLKADFNCSVDAARILRIPGTFNHKTSIPRPVEIVGGTEDVYSFDRIKRALEPYKSAVAPIKSEIVIPRAFADPAARAAITTRYHGLNGSEPSLGAGIERDTTPRNLDAVATQCGFVREAIDTAGKDYNEPLWNLTTLIATFAEGGRGDAHRMASGHPGYTPESTDAKFDQKEKANVGWPSCKSISDSGCKHCAACPHFSNGKSPLNFTPKVTASDTFEAERAGSPAVSSCTALVPFTKPPLRPGEYDFAQAMAVLNGNFFVSMGAHDKGKIFAYDDDGTIAHLTKDDFSLATANIKFAVETSKGTVYVPSGPAWQGYEDRNQKSIVFKPGQHPAEGEYNLYTGFAMSPKRGRDKMRKLLRHVRRYICRDNTGYYRYLIKRYAWMLQHPAEHTEVVAVFHSETEGTGKTTIGKALCKIFGIHAMALSRKQQITGDFNEHLEYLIYVLVEEALFSSDHATADALKDMITSEWMTIRPMRRKARQVQNYINFDICTNHPHAISAGVGARRMFVLEVDDSKANDVPYWDAMYKDLREGGYEQLLNYLLSIELKGWHPRQVPKTEMLKDQMRMSGDSFTQWMLMSAEVGHVVGFKSSDPHLELGHHNPTAKLREAYENYCKSNSLGRPLGSKGFSQKLAKICGDRVKTNSEWGYFLPSEKVLPRAIDEALLRIKH
jgi:hypothetical protein